MMPWTRRALRGREESKSRQIKNIEAVKRAYRKLAKMLKREVWAVESSPHLRGAVP